MCLHRCVAPATTTTDCGPLPPLLKHSMIVFSFSPTLCCSLFKNTCRLTFLQFFLSLFCTPTLLWCICLFFSEHPHYVHGYILRASLFDFGLSRSEWWAGGSCRAGRAYRAPQPSSRRVGFGVLSGWALLQKHWSYC